MKIVYSDEGVHTRLVLAALDELCSHGVEDFSLRRVAISAQVSCAAPYRHFKSKEELIVETARYITSKWRLLADEIIEAHGEGSARTLTELSVSAVKFWISNGKFRSLLMPGKDSPIADEMKKFDSPILDTADLYFKEKGVEESVSDVQKKRIFAVIYGAVLLISAGKLSNSDAVFTVEQEILTMV